MPSIRLRLVTCAGFIGRSIRFVTDGLPAHVEFGTPQGTWIGAHHGSGVQERPDNYCTPTWERYYEIPTTAKVEAEHLARIKAACGKLLYNDRDILGLMLRQRKVTSFGRVICSQFVSDEMLTIFGAGKYLNIESGYTHLITPRDVHLCPLLAGNLKRRIG